VLNVRWRLADRTAGLRPQYNRRWPKRDEADSREQTGRLGRRGEMTRGSLKLGRFCGVMQQ
jgi:hypothetical protein